MTKQIKVSDELYLRLKGHADSNYRTQGGQIEFLLDHFEGIKVAEPRSLGEAIHVDRPVDIHIPADVTTPQELYKEAKQMQADLIEDLKFNQDPDSRHQMERERGEAIQAKWAEYHTAKGGA